MEKILQNANHLKIDHYYPEFKALIQEKRRFLDQATGNFSRFQKIVKTLPDCIPSNINLEGRQVAVGEKSDLSDKDHCLLLEKLEQLCPWRKGPFDLFGIKIDSEWQSWMKWDRLSHDIENLKGRKILDIGSSNGYYMFRMAFHNPLMVLGVEPQSLFYFQYLAVQKFLNQDNVYCLPVTYDHLPEMDNYFDTVFCMGVLYHRKSPIQMLSNIYDSLGKGGQLILENLVIDSKQDTCLFPKKRYAKMRNVFFIPDLLVMESWLLRAGFTNIKCIDVTKTSLQEQRKTQWIQTQTLNDFLDPNDSDKTIEGYPAPVRAIFTANAA